MREIEKKIQNNPDYAWELLDRGLVVMGTALHERCLEAVADDIVLTLFDVPNLGELLEGKAPKLRKKDRVTAIQDARVSTEPKFKRQQGRDFRKFKKEADKSVQVLEKDLRKMAAAYVEGRSRMPFEKFAARMRNRLEKAHKRAFELGGRAAGLDRADTFLPTMQTRLDSLLKEELGYLNEFLNDIKAGKSKGGAPGRAAKYAESVTGTFNQGRAIAMPSLSLYRWHLESDNPCNDCKLIARHSPYTRATLPTVPKAGSTRCLQNCYCSLEVELTSEQKIKQHNARHISRKEMIKRIKKLQKRQMGRSLV